MFLFFVYALCFAVSFGNSMLYAQDVVDSSAYTEEQSPEEDLAEQNIDDGLEESTEESDLAEDEDVSDQQETDVQDEPEIDEVEQEDSSIEVDDQAQEADSDQDLSELDQQEVSGDEPEPEPEEQEDEPQDDEPEIVEPEGIDTVNINEPEGNWLFKRIWWEKSKDFFGKIRDKVDKIVESRMYFFEQRVKLDREFVDPFYVDVGLDQGALKESVENLLNILKAEREKDGVLDEDELDTYNKLLESKVTLENLAGSVASVQKLDAGLDESLNKLAEQINLARSYERDAWRLLNEIAEELSDKKAREHYYAIATLWRNVKEIARYIEGAFGQHFLELSKLTIENIQNINKAIDDLQEKGIALKESVNASQEEEVVEEQELIEDEVPVTKKESGWLSDMWQWLLSWFGR